MCRHVKWMPAIVAALVMAVGIAMVQAQRAGDAARANFQRFEYRVVTALEMLSGLDDKRTPTSAPATEPNLGAAFVEMQTAFAHAAELKLNQLGDDGWELVTISHDGAWIFRRPK